MIRSTTQKYSYKNNYNTAVQYKIIKKIQNIKKNKEINLHLTLKTFVAGVRETRDRRDCGQDSFHCHGITAIYWLNGIFSFLATLTRNLSNDTCFCLLLRILWKCDIALSLNRFIVHTATTSFGWCFSTKFCNFPHFTHLPNLT